MNVLRSSPVSKFGENFITPLKKMNGNPIPNSSLEEDYSTKRTCGIRTWCGFLSCDDRTQSTRVDFVIYLLLKDLKFKDRNHPRKNYFIPFKHPSFYPSISLANTEPPQLISESQSICHATGEIIFKINYVITARISNYNVSMFPFDKQYLSWGISALNFGIRKWESESTNLPVNISRWKDFDCSTLNYVSSCWKIAPSNSVIYDDGDDSFINLEFEAERESGFYITNFAIVIFLLGLVSLSTFWMKPDDLSSRININVTLVLATIAFKYASSTNLPAVNYLTLLDKYLIMAFILLALNILENYIIFWIPSEYGFWVERGWFGFSILFWVFLHIFVVLLNHKKHFLRRFQTEFTSVRQNYNYHTFRIKN